jgi:RING-type zinc-finger
VVKYATPGRRGNIPCANILQIVDLGIVQICATKLRGVQIIATVMMFPSGVMCSLMFSLRDLKKHHATSCVVITRPPEIIACIKIPTSLTDVFLIFDSHPRPSHPDGAGFTFNTSVNTTARYLTNLLAVDRRLLADKNMQWQTQLLGNFSGHIFVSNSDRRGVEELSETVLESSLTILALREEIAGLKDQNSSLIEDKRRMSTELNAIKAKHRRDQGQLDAGLWSGPSQGQSNNRSSTRTSPSAIASTSRVHKEFYRDPSPPRQPLVYYSGDPCPPSNSTLSTSHLDADSNSFDISSNDDHGISFLTQVQLALEEFPHPGSQKALEKQREFEEEDRRLAAECMALRAHFAIFSCTVCFEDHPEDYLARITGCDHTFCRDCLRSYIISKVTDHRYPIFCPVCITDKGSSEPSGK